jgi:hypothetical protein
MTQLLTATPTPQARGDDAPDARPSSAHPVLKPPPNFQLLRKLLRLGHSYAVTIPDAWVHAHCKPELPYLTTTLQPDGAILIRPFNPKHPLGSP